MFCFYRLTILSRINWLYLIGESKNILDSYIYWTFIGLLSLSLLTALTKAIQVIEKGCELTTTNINNKQKFLFNNQHHVPSLRRFSPLEQNVRFSAGQELCWGIYAASHPKQWAFYKPAGPRGRIQAALFGRILVFLLFVSVWRLCPPITQELHSTAKITAHE